MLPCFYILFFFLKSLAFTQLNKFVLSPHLVILLDDHEIFMSIELYVLSDCEPHINIIDHLPPPFHSISREVL